MTAHRFLTSFCAASALALAAASAQAATLTVTGITASWINTIGGTDVSTSNNGTGNPELRWGEARKQSGYDFDANAAIYNVAQAEDVDFDLGTLTHLNFPIATGTGIKGASLSVTLDFFLDADPGTTLTRTSVFDFAHWETPNGANPCANGDAQGAGVNVNGCADRVTALTNVGSSETFEIGGVKYIFDVTGFEVGPNPLTEFWTVENAENHASLTARFTTLTTVTPVPLPAGGLLLLGGLGALGAIRRRRNAA